MQHVLVIKLLHRVLTAEISEMLFQGQWVTWLLERESMLCIHKKMSVIYRGP